MPIATEAQSTIPDRHFAALNRLEQGYWWYEGRLAWARRLVSPWLSSREPRNVRYADVGCGTGGFATRLANELDLGRTALVDSHPAALSHLKGHARFTVVAADITKDLRLPFAPDLVTCMDVLEHVPDDGDLLARMAQALPPGGLAILSVPAFPWLYSEWDRLLGHHRRYTRGALAAKVTKAGLRVRDVRYMWSFLFPAAPYRRLRPAKQAALEFPEVSPWMNQALIAMSRLEWHLSGLVRPPFGTSLILSATKP